MDTIFQKVSMLVTSKMHTAMGRKPAKSNESRLGQAVVELLRTEMAIAKLQSKLHDLQEDAISMGKQIYQQDKIIDEYLLHGDDASAVHAQRELNRLHQRLLRLKRRFQQLTAQRERLQTVQDQLEVKISLMGLDRHTLNEFLRRARTEQSNGHSQQQWCVVEPDEI